MVTEQLPPGARITTALPVLAFIDIVLAAVAVLWTWWEQDTGGSVTVVILIYAVVSVIGCELEASMVNATSDGRPVYWIHTDERAVPLRSLYSTSKFVVVIVVGFLTDGAIVAGLVVRQGGPTAVQIVIIVASIAITGEALARTWAGVRRFRAASDEGPSPTP